MIDQYIREHNGVKFHNFRAGMSSVGVACIGNKRVVLPGKPKFTIMRGSAKFGDELQVTILASKKDLLDAVKIQETRNSSEWNTIEINIPLCIGEELIRALYEAIK